MGTKTLMSLGEFMSLPDNGMRHELNRGELVTMPPPKSLHGRVATGILTKLHRYVSEKGSGAVVASAGFHLFPGDEPTVRQPDVALLRPDQLARTDDDDYFEGTPELAVEVVAVEHGGRTP